MLRKGVNMTHRVQEVKAKDNLIIEVVFLGGEVKKYDVKNLFNQFPQFKELLINQEVFNNVSVDAGGYGISWNDELDLDAETLWADGILIEFHKSSDINHILAYQLLQAREEAKLTQKDLSEKTGIYQADISKIERGIGNPSLLTIKRLADGLDMDLEISFQKRRI